MLDVGRWTFLFLLFVLPALAAPPIITAKPLTDSLRLRKGGPIPLEIELTNRGPGLTEGRLEASVLFRDRRASVETSAEIALLPGKRSVSLLLPPPSEVEDGDRLGLRLRWLGKEASYDLDESKLGTYGFSGNEQILAIVRTDRRLSDRDLERERRLTFETIRPMPDVEGWLPLNTLQVSLPIDRLPDQPLGWCAYDAVFFDTAAFQAASEKQLTTLARWIESGGSAFISITDSTPLPLAERHAAFLNRLASGREAVFRLEGAELRAESKYQGVAIPLAPMLGRVVVQVKDDSSPGFYRSTGWHAAVGWFWKVCSDQIGYVEVNGTWNKIPRRAEREEAQLSELRRWLWSSAMGFDELSPDAPRPLPLGLVMILLGSLLLAAGPGDWMLLGWLRRRRWTWLLLPALCLLAAWCANLLAARTISRRDLSAVVTVTDVTPGGQVLRQGRLEMMLPAKDRAWSMTMHDGFATPFLREDGDDPGEATGEWPVPSQFVLHRNLQQWTPVVSQGAAFPEAPDDSGIPWETLAAKWARSTPHDRFAAYSTHADWTIVFVQRSHSTSASGPEWLWPSTYPAPPSIDERRGFTVDGQFSDNSRLTFHQAVSLALPGTSSLPQDLITHTSPTVTGIEALMANTPAPLLGVAWKQTAHEMHIIRCHFFQFPQ